MSKSHDERSEFTLSWRSFARARVIGPLGGLGGVDVGASVGWAASAPLGKESSSTLHGCRLEHLHGRVRDP